MRDAKAAYKTLQDESVRLLDEDDLDGAEPLVIESLVRAKKLFGAKHAEVAECTYNLGSLHRRKGRLVKAVATLQKAHALQEALGESHCKDAARTLSDIANVLVAQGAFARCKPIVARALEELRTCGVRDSDYAIALGDYARCCQEEGDFAAARTACDEAIACSEAEGLTELATNSRVSRGTAWLRLGDFARAIADYEVAYEEERKRLPVDSPDLVETRLSLFNAKTSFGCKELDENGDRAKARREFDEALALVESEDDSERVVSALCNASAAAARTDDLARASELAQRAVEMGRRLGAKGTLAVALYHRANAYALDDDCARAVPLLERAIEIQKRVKLDTPMRLVESIRLLGVALSGIDMDAQAAKKFRAAIALAKKHGATDDSIEIVQAEEGLAIALRDDDDDNAALPLYEKRLKRLERTVGRDHVDYADELEQLAHIVSRVDGPRAGAFYRDVLDIRERVVPHSEDIVTAIKNLALWHIDEEDADGALPIAERALAVSIATLGASHDATADAWDTLARARLAKHLDESADDAFMHAIGLREAIFGADAEETTEMVRDAADLVEDEWDRCPRLAARYALLRPAK